MNIIEENTVLLETACNITDLQEHRFIGVIKIINGLQCVPLWVIKAQTNSG